MKALGIVLAMILAVGVAWVVWPARSTKTYSAPLRSAVEHSDAREVRDENVDSRASSRVALVDTPATTTPVDSTDLVTVRSREGFKLRSIEVELADARWRRIALVDEHVARGELATTNRVRAPGHRPQVVDHDAKEITLDADALLIVECPDLVESLDAVQEWNLHEAERTPPGELVYCVQRLGANRIGLAVTCDDAGHDNQPLRVELPFAWKSGLAGTIHFDALPDARAHWDLPCPPLVRTANLVVTLESSDHVALERCTVSIVDEHREIEPETDPPTETLPFPLGTLEWRKPRPFHAGGTVRSQASADGSQRATFYAIPLGTPLTLTARDDESSYWGVVSWVHDGGDVHMTLHAPFTLTGRIVASDPSFWSLEPRVVWSLRYASGEEPAMESVYALEGGAPRHGVLGENGAFELHGPEPSEQLDRHSAAIPSIVEVTVSGLGFGPVTKHLVMDASGRVDCGVIEIADAEPDLRVLLDDSVKRPLVAARRPLTIQWEDGGLQWAHVDRVREHDGVLDVYTSNPESRLVRGLRGEQSTRIGGVPSARPAATQWRDGVLQLSRTVRFLTSPERGVMRGFTRVEGKTYRAVPNADYEVTIEKTREQQEVDFGLVWMGIPEESESRKSLEGRRTTQTLHISAPATDVGVWWLRVRHETLRFGGMNDVANEASHSIGPGVSRVVIPVVREPATDAPVIHEPVLTPRRPGGSK